MADQKVSEKPELLSLGANYYLLVIQVSGNTYTTSKCTLQTLLNNMVANTHISGTLTVDGGLFANSSQIVANVNTLVQGELVPSELRVANTHLELTGGTFTPSGNTVAGEMATGVQVFFDDDYVYYSINGNVRRVASEKF